MQNSASKIRTKTSAGRPIAWFTLRVKWHTWAQERKLSNPQTIRGDFRYEQKPENIHLMLQDMLNYLEDYFGEMEEVQLYDNRRSFPHCQLLVIRSAEIRVNNLPENIQEYASRVFFRIKAQKVLSNS